MPIDSHCYAHSLPPPHTRADWEPLDEHLARVAELAERFAAAFGAGKWGRLAGEWHDLGKRSAAFQQYIGNHPDDPDASEDAACREPVNYSPRMDGRC